MSYFSPYYVTYFIPIYLIHSLYSKYEFKKFKNIQNSESELNFALNDPLN